MDIRAGTTGQSVSFAAWTTATGAAATVTSATAGLALWYRRGATGPKTAITPSDLATLETAHADGGILVISEQEHRLDLPDAAVAAGVDRIEWGGSATGITIDGGTANLIGQANTGPVGAFALQSPDAGETALLRGEVEASVDAEALAAELAPVVWSHPERTLTTPAQIPDDETSVASITRRRGDSWSVSITGLGSLAGRDELWWTIKRSRDDSDDEAIYQATEGLGITVDDASAGDITLRILAAVTALFSPRTYYYDVQVLLGDGTVQTLAEGEFTVLADVTRATSPPAEPET